MAMDLDELDVVDDDSTVEEPVENDGYPQQTESQLDIPDIDDDDEPQEDVDALSEFLREKGISDASKIKFENEDGTVEERSWNELSEEEKLNILNTQEDTSDYDLDDNEIDLINRLRLSQMDVADFVNSIKQQGAQEYAQQYSQMINNSAPAEPYSYTVDDLSDDELYVLDLQARVADISDEELQEALDRAKSNETLFEKEVAGLREDYKRMEDERNQQQQALIDQERQEQFAAFSSSIVDNINAFTNIGELDVSMDDDDKNNLYDFITGVDAAGVNHFAKALNDPETIVKTAWFAMHGEDIINSISNYYKNQIQTVARANYEKGLMDAKSKNASASKVVIKPQINSRQKNSNLKSIDDLD